MKFCYCRRTLYIYNQGPLIRPNVINLKSLKVIISRTLLHLGSFITFRPSTQPAVFFFHFFELQRRKALYSRAPWGTFVQVRVNISSIHTDTDNSCGHTTDFLPRKTRLVDSSPRET